MPGMIVGNRGIWVVTANMAVRHIPQERAVHADALIAIFQGFDGAVGQDISGCFFGDVQKMPTVF